METPAAMFSWLIQSESGVSSSNSMLFSYGFMFFFFFLSILNSSIRAVLVNGPTSSIRIRPWGGGAILEAWDWPRLLVG